MKSRYQEAYDKWALDKTPENMSDVLDSLMPTINSEIMRYEGPKAHLRSRAKAIAVNAVKSYNPASGSKLQSWVTTNLKQLSRYGQGLRDVKAPELAIRRAAEIDRVTRLLADELGRDPTDEEISDEIGISPKKIKRIRHQASTSINTGSFELDNQEEQGQLPGVSAPNPVDYASDAVYMSLGQRDKDIFDYRTGMHGKTSMPNSEIARLLGISAPAVSQRADYIGKLIQQVSMDNM